MLLLLHTTAQAQQLYRVPMQVKPNTELGEDRLVITPENLQFERTAVGEQRTAQLAVVNQGTRTVSLQTVELTGEGFTTVHDCMGTLEPSESCQMDVLFQPRVAGEATGSIELRSSAGTKTWAVPLVGTAGVGELSVSRTRIAIEPLQVHEHSAPATVTVSNPGDADLVGLRVELPETSSGLRATTNCPSSLSPAASCLVEVVFAPEMPQSLRETVVVSSGTLSVAIEVEGTAVSPSATISSVTFEDQQVGSKAQRSATLANTGVGPLVVQGLQVEGVGFAQGGTTCPSILARGASCSMTVEFTPVRGGAHFGTLLLQTNAGAQQAPLTGSGLQGIAAVSPASIQFPRSQLGDAEVSTVTVTNMGNGALTMGEPTLSSGFDGFSFLSTCATLAPGASCAISVAYKPIVPGSAVATLLLPHDGQGATPISVSLAGEGRTPSATLAGATAPDTAVGQSNIVSLSLTNTGIGWISVGAPTVSGAGFALAGTSCAANLAPGATCQVSARFNPTADGAHSATVLVPSSAGVLQAVVSGTGIPIGDPGFDYEELYFEDTQVGGWSMERTMVLPNWGAGSLSFETPYFTSGGSDFQFSTTGCENVLPGFYCLLSVTFAPSSPSYIAGNLVIPHNGAGQGYLQVGLFGRGTW